MGYTRNLVRTLAVTGIGVGATVAARSAAESRTQEPGTPSINADVRVRAAQEFARARPRHGMRPWRTTASTSDAISPRISKTSETALFRFSAGIPEIE